MAPRLDIITSLIAQQVGVVSCAVTMMGRPIDGSDEVAADLEDWQFVLADGPAIASSRSCRPVEYDDPEAIAYGCGLFAGHLADAGIGSVAAFPLMLGVTCIGTITLYSRAHRLGPSQRECAVRWAQQLVAFICDDPVRWTHHRSRVARDFDLATGFVMAAGRMESAAAASLIRARAFLDATSLRTLCAEIVAGSLRVDRDSLT
jgi:hypothetical protein